MTIWSRLATVAIVFLVSASRAEAQSARSAEVPGDPAVQAYVSFVEARRIVPIDTRFIIAALDRLISAIEGIALARNVAREQLLTAAHRIRQDVRRLDAFESTKPRAIFIATARLLADLNRNLDNAIASEPRLEALLRSADSLEQGEPARWQVDNVERFFRHASEALQHMGGY